MTYQHTFQVQAPIERVLAFHQSSESLKAITPSVFRMHGLRAPLQLSEGDQMAFTLWIGPLPVQWEARLENFSEAGFDDVQLKGPFAVWKHTHRFQALDEGGTRITDRVEYRLRRHGVWGPVGFAMAMGLPLLFWFRAQKTKTLLERSIRPDVT
ncbi:MAG: hypothetical protein E4G99_10430 [Anaerolineales bacterium]|nr:MAG: hypothetical protein E4G99_10430 [Anaerolineales bacterium]